jgi:cytochrome c-type biogenesis protein CcmH
LCLVIWYQHGQRQKQRSVLQENPMKKKVPTIRFFFTLLLFFLISITVLNFQSVHAQQPTPSDDEVNAIARQLFCPICENIPLDVCPTEACHDWRELIRQMLGQGQTPAEIKQYFVEHYGARVLSEPPRAGLNWLVYIIPPLTLLIGTVFLFRAFRMWRAKSKVTLQEQISTNEAVVGDEYTSRIEDELRKRK